MHQCCPPLHRPASVLPQLRVCGFACDFQQCRRLTAGYSQIEVTGGGSTVPSGSELVSIPGLYKNVQWPDIWSDNFKSFKIPGPAALGDSSSDSGNSDPASSSAEASSTKASSATHASSTAVSASASSTHVSTTAAHTSAESAPTSSSVATSSAAASTGRCKAKRSRRGMVKRHVSHHAKRHH